MSEDPLAHIDPRGLGARLREAREARRWTQQQLAERLGMARTTVVAIEKGERRLKPGELVQASSVLGRSVSELLQRVPDQGEGIAVQLRGIAPAEADLSAPIGELQRLCEDYVRLEELCEAPLRRRYPAEYDIQGTDSELAAEDVAVAERRRLDLGEGPLVNLRDTLEADVGLRIFQIEMPAGVAGMFAFAEPTGGCIAANLLHSPERRRTAIAQEYGHFLTARYSPEITFLDRYERKPAAERFAEAFARAFLLPAAGLRRRFLEIERERPRGLTFGALLRLARFYGSSPEAVIRRLEGLRLIPAGTWERLSRGPEPLGLGPIPADDETFSSRYLTLAIEAWQREQLTEGQLARLLRTDRLGAREWIDRFQQSTTEGTGPKTLDFAAPLLRSASR